MSKFLIIEISNLSFVRQIKTNISGTKNEN